MAPTHSAGVASFAVPVVPTAVRRVAVILALIALMAPRWSVPGLHPEPLFAGAPDVPLFTAIVMPPLLEQEFIRKQFKRDPRSGNFLSAKVAARTLNEMLVPLQIGGKYAKDLRGNAIFVRQTVRDKLLIADAAMFKKKHEHIKVNFGFRSNIVQAELYKQLSGKGKVAPPGSSFHETGMALDVSNWKDAQRFMIEAGFVGGCYGIEEDFVHYSINELTKASDMSKFKRCTLKEIPEMMVNGVKKAGNIVTGGRFLKKKPQ